MSTQVMVDKTGTRLTEAPTKFPGAELTDTLSLFAPPPTLPQTDWKLKSNLEMLRLGNSRVPGIACMLQMITCKNRLFLSKFFFHNSNGRLNTGKMGTHSSANTF